jgi:hypothetical protein
VRHWSVTATAVNQPFGAVGLEVACDLVELLAGMAYQLADAADIREVASKLQDRELAACYLVLGRSWSSSVRVG